MDDPSSNFLETISDCHFFQLAQEFTRTEMSCSDEDIRFAVGQGNPQGDTVAAFVFVAVFEQLVGHCLNVATHGEFDKARAVPPSQTSKLIL